MATVCVLGGERYLGQEHNAFQPSLRLLLKIHVHQLHDHPFLQKLLVCLVASPSVPTHETNQTVHVNCNSHRDCSLSFGHVVIFNYVSDVKRCATMESYPFKNLRGTGNEILPSILESWRRGRSSRLSRTKRKCHI